MSDNATGVNNSFDGDICSVRFFFCGIRANVLFHAINNYLRHPFGFSIGSELNTKKAGCAFVHCATAVLKVDSTAYITKIFKSVVRPVPIDVVNISTGPTPILVEPDQPVRLVLDAVDSNADITKRRDMSGGRPNDNATACFVFPHKGSRFGQVIKHLADSFCCVGFSFHIEHHKSIWQKPIMLYGA